MIGALLAGWIAIQFWMIGYVSFFQPLMLAVGVLIVAAALLGRRGSAA